MKRSFTFLLGCLLMTGLMSSNAQVTAEWITPEPHGNDYDDIEFVSETVGIAIAKGGAITRTTDGGTTWENVASTTSMDLTDICWIDANNVVVAGNAGTLLYSGDAGATWTSKYFGMSLNIRKVHFVSATVGFLVANSTSIYKTMDGGDTWDAGTFENTSNLTSVFFLDENKGWAVGEASTVVYTQDGGATWMAGFVPPIIVISAPNFNDVYFKDATNGLIVGATGVVLTTTDGGMMWNAVMEGAPGQDLYTLVPGPDAIWATTADANGVIYSTADNGGTWAATVSVGPFGRILGKTAADADTLLRDGLNSGTILDVSFAGSKMVVVGYGVISSSTDNGATWPAYDPTFRPNVWIQSLGFSADMQTVYAGTNGLKNYAFSGNHVNSHMYKSTDGGMTWEHKPAFNWGGASNSPVTQVLVNPNDANHVVMLGRKRGQWTRDGGDTFYNTNDLYVSEDSVAIKGGAGLIYDDNFAGQWIDDSTVISIGGSHIMISTDTAKTWRNIYDNKAPDDKDSIVGMPSILSNCAFIDRYNGFVSGRAGGLMKTTDGGETWINISENVKTAEGADLSKNFGNMTIDPSNPNNIAITLDNRNAVVSADGGETWIYCPFGGTYGCNDITYIAPGVLWTTGKNPHISMDNGKTWLPRKVSGVSNTKQTDDAHIINATTLLETGALSSKRMGSTIVKYTMANGMAYADEQATAVNFTNMGIDTAQFTVNWTRGNGDNCAAFIRMYNAGDSVPSLSAFNDYQASSVWGEGQRSNDGWFCIYNGTGTSVDVTGLPMDTMYTVFVAEYKNGMIYNVTNAAGNAAHSPEFTVGINKVSAFEGFGVYPNPSTGLVNVAVRAEKAGMGSFKIMSLTGQVIDTRSQKINTGLNQYQFDLSDLSAGIYFVEVVKGDKRNVSRLVIK